MQNENVETGYADINGAQFYYEVAGEGHPLVLVHAGIADNRMWDDQFKVFAQYYRVVRYDLRGFGQTTMVAGEFAHYKDLFGLMRHLGIDKAHLMGCSKGGATIIDFALAYPEMVGALIPVSTALHGYQYSGEMPEIIKDIEAAEEAGDIEKLNELEIRMWIDGPKRRSEQVNSQFRQKVLDMNRIALMTPPDLGTETVLEPRAAERVHDLKCPMQIIAGELDVPKTILVANLMTVKVPCAKKVVIPCASHLPNMEEPTLFNTCVLKFLHDMN